ncbi:MAG TPA: cysteine dioxygenase family protein [Solirubrobacteraceae bacterium]
MPPLDGLLTRPTLRGPRRDLVGEELAAFASRLAGARDRWAHLVRHTDDARVYELIWADRHVNAWVICWSAGQDTGFHDHGRSAGAIHVVDGSISEERMGLTRPAGRRTFGAGASFHVPSCAIHRVFHGGHGPAVSVHAYSPPLTQMGDYRSGPDGALERDARDCAVPLEAGA